ncbi:MAG: nuclear transport factor 2 family protein [Proteobacteria bacterium]|nr:nuclear transport factor 2 family protein [Pseudomonadota bacterium]
MQTIQRIFAATAVAGALLITPLGSAWAGDAETKAIVEHHLAAFGAGDMKDTLSDYTETSVIVTQGGELRGLEAIQGLFASLFAEFAKPGASFDLKLLSTANNVGYIVWSAETADNVYELGTDTYVIEDGKIAVQTLAIQAVPKK